MSDLQWSTSLGCLNPLELEQDISTLTVAGCRSLHVDVADGVFVPEFLGGLDVIRAVAKETALEVEAHLMIERPERHIERFIQAGCSTITVHVESSTHIHRALAQIRELGAKPGIAINAATPLTKLEYLFSLVDRVLLLRCDPQGTATRVLASNALERAKVLHDNIAYHERRIVLCAEGQMGPRDAALLKQSGVDEVVLDATILHAKSSLEGSLDAYQQELSAEQEVI